MLIVALSAILFSPVVGASDSATLTSNVSRSGASYTYKYTLANSASSADPINIIQIRYDGVAVVGSTPPTNWLFFPSQSNRFFEFQCVCSGGTGQALQPGQSLDFVVTSDSSYVTDDIRLVDWNQVQAGGLSGGALTPSSGSGQPVPAILGPKTVTGTPTNGTVGGTIVPVDKLGLLIPYIGLAFAVGFVTVAVTAIYVTRVRRRKQEENAS